jgi:eukaryotic-like serine/threonine-protein kinase
MDEITDRSQFRIGDLLVVPDRLMVVRDGQEIALELRMMEILIALAENAGQTLSTAHLLREFWGNEVYGDNPVIKTIARLRKAIADDSRDPRYIETISKAGYRLIAPLSRPEKRPSI